MEEQTSWKGHSFTLMVFTGIVVLCSIFFVLGMLVGRTQGQKIASIAAIEAAGKDADPVQEENPEMTFSRSLESQSQPLEQAVAAKPAPAVAPPPEVSVAPAIGSAINYQIAALSKQADAEKLVNDLKKKNFRAFILAPASGDANPFFRVQVGPFREEQEAELVKRQLEAAGYKPIAKK